MLEILYKSDYLSIKKFNPVLIEDLTVITGLNGSGKTHFLKAIKEGNIEIKGFAPSEIVYYSYEDFLVNTEKSKDNPKVKFKIDKSTADRSNNINKINQVIATIRNDVLNDIGKVDSIDHYFLSLATTEFDFKSINDSDIESITTLKDKNVSLNELYTYQGEFNTHLFAIIENYLSNENYSIHNFDLKQLEQRFHLIKNRIIERSSNGDDDLFNYLKGFNNNLLSINPHDLATTDFFLEEIANEQKAYLFAKAQNAARFGVAYQNKQEHEPFSLENFEKLNGISPVDRINEVLVEFNYSGYRLLSQDLYIQMGIDASNQEVAINLHDKDLNIYTTFDLLSSGEKTLIALGLLIYKSRKKIMPRILLLDEIDSSLHPSMIEKLLDVLTKYFVNKLKIKIIIVTHSPTTVAKAPYDSVFLLNKTGDAKLERKSRSKAINVLSEGFAALDESEGSLGITYNISKSDLPILFTEGITDKIIIETAWNKLNPDLKAPFITQDCFGASFLRNYFDKNEKDSNSVVNQYPKKKFIILFDFDKEGYDCWEKLKKRFNYTVESDPFKCLTCSDENGRVSILLLPVPNTESIKKQVIKANSETYKNQSVLAIEHLFFGIPVLENHFKVTKTAGDGSLIEFIGDKTFFSTKVKELNQEHFENFKPLFEKIAKLID